MKITINRHGGQRGIIFVILSILVAVFLGVIVYGIYRITHLPTKSPKNDDVTYYSDGQGNTWSAIEVNDTNPPPNQTLVIPADLTTNSFCTFQYKLLVDTNDIPFTTLVMGTNMIDGTITALIDTPEEYEITFTVGSQVYIEDYDAVSGGVIGSSVTPAYSGDPYVTIYQRNTGTGWQCIDTNADCEVGTIYTYTDPNPPADHALYRIEITQ